MRPNMDLMTLREKIAQTGMPGINELNQGIKEYGSFEEYLTRYPFCGVYIEAVTDKDGNKFSDPATLASTLREASERVKIPLLVSSGPEFGCYYVFPQLHRICSNMSIGAAFDGSLAYKCAFYWAKEMRSFGVNWACGPVVDRYANFFSPHAIRFMSSDYKVIKELIPHFLKGIHDAGLASCVKHYPGGSEDYRDAHYTNIVNNISLEEWLATDGEIYKAATAAGAMSVMVDHTAIPAMDDSRTYRNVRRPASASQKALDILRNEIGFDGLIVSDAVSMKGITSAFEHEDVYIECLNAGNDIVLFCHNDYIDVIEKAVMDGRVSIDRVNDACRRVLDLKEKLGLFEKLPSVGDLTEAENTDFEQVIYDIGKKAMTLIRNEDHLIPVDPTKVKKVAIIKQAPSARFSQDLEHLIQAFSRKGIETTVLDTLRSKEQLKELAKNNDMIVYACYIAQSEPRGMPFFSAQQELRTLLNGLSYGASKSIVVSFGNPSIYYNYYEEASTYINAYSCDPGTMSAFVDGIFGEFAFSQQSPVPLYPELKNVKIR